MLPWSRKVKTVSKSESFGLETPGAVYWVFFIQGFFFFFLFYLLHLFYNARAPIILIVNCVWQPWTGSKLWLNIWTLSGQLKSAVGLVLFFSKYPVLKINGSIICNLQSWLMWCKSVAFHAIFWQSWPVFQNKLKVVTSSWICCWDKAAKTM